MAVQQTLHEDPVQGGLNLIATQWEASMALLGNFNLRDYLNLRHASPSFLRSFPLVPQSNRPAIPAFPALPWVPQPFLPRGLPPAPVPENMLGENLGASCHDTRAPPWHGPCPSSSPLRPILMRHCSGAKDVLRYYPRWPHGAFNVCEECNRQNCLDRRVSVTPFLEWRRAIYCKRCSLRTQREYPQGRLNACRCSDFITEGWACWSCQEERQTQRLLIGAVWMDDLETMHFVRDRKTKKKRFVEDRSRRRKRPACPTPGCGEKPVSNPSIPLFFVAEDKDRVIGIFLS